MITLNLNIGDNLKTVNIKEDVIFNAIICEHPLMIKKLIKTILPFYKIDKNYFAIVNRFIDFTEDAVSIYPGLIVRTGLVDYAVLFLEGSTIDEDYMIKLIKEYIYDLGIFNPSTVNINKFEISKSDFLMASRKL